MRRSLFICLLWVGPAACGPIVIETSAQDPFVFDRDSSAKLAQLSPRLAEGRYVYGVHFMLPAGKLTDAAAVETVAVAPHAGGLRVAVDAMTVETDAGGNYLGSQDGTGSAETVQRLTLPPRALGPASWARAAGAPLYTQAELRAVNASGRPKTKTVVDHSRALGVKQLPDGTHVVAVRRDLRSYVVPSDAALRDGPARAAAGFTNERPGVNEQRGTAYAWFAVLPGSEAVLLVEAAILFPRLPSIPDSLEPYLDGRTPGVAWVRKLDVTAAGVPAAQRPALERALGALPASPRPLFLDRSPGGNIVAAGCVHCGGL